MIIVGGAGGECVGFFIVMLIKGGSVASYSQALSGRRNCNLVKDDLFRHAWMHMRHSPTRKHTQLTYRHGALKWMRHTHTSLCRQLQVHT